MGHLRSENGRLVHSHGGEVLSVDRLVREQSRGGDHGRSHTVSDEEDDVLGGSLLGEREDGPSGGGRSSSVVGESCDVVSNFVEGDVSVRLGEDVDVGGRSGVLSEQILREEINTESRRNFSERRKAPRNLSGATRNDSRPGKEHEPRSK